jgi:hypothetical protein
MGKSEAKGDAENAMQKRIQDVKAKSDDIGFDRSVA